LKNEWVEEGAVLRIKLTRDKYAIVDRDDASALDILRKYKFYAKKIKSKYCAVHEEKGGKMMYLHRMLLLPAGAGAVVRARDGDLLNCSRGNLKV